MEENFFQYCPYSCCLPSSCSCSRWWCFQRLYPHSPPSIKAGLVPVQQKRFVSGGSWIALRCVISEDSICDCPPVSDCGGEQWSDVWDKMLVLALPGLGFVDMDKSQSLHVPQFSHVKMAITLLLTTWSSCERNTLFHLRESQAP